MPVISNPNTVPNEITFEQPLNESIRNCLRLEYLFQLIHFGTINLSLWDCRHILRALLSIDELLSNSNLRTELIKALERHAHIFTIWQNNLSVDQRRLAQLRDDTEQLLLQLKDKHYQPGIQLTQSKFLMNVKNRIHLPYGTCNFDLPWLHYWLNQPVDKRREDIDNWKEDFAPINTAVDMILNMIRQRNHSVNKKAKFGFYQQSIEATSPAQLLRVVLSANSKYYPEISGGKHFFTIRFMEQTSDKPKQTENDVDFELQCCTL